MTEGLSSSSAMSNGRYRSSRISNKICHPRLRRTATDRRESGEAETNPYRLAPSTNGPACSPYACHSDSRPALDDPRAEAARLQAEIEQVRAELAETRKLISCLAQEIRSKSLERV